MGAMQYTHGFSHGQWADNGHEDDAYGVLVKDDTVTLVSKLNDMTVRVWGSAGGAARMDGGWVGGLGPRVGKLPMAWHVRGVRLCLTACQIWVSRRAMSTWIHRTWKPQCKCEILPASGSERRSLENGDWREGGGGGGGEHCIHIPLLWVQITSVLVLLSSNSSSSWWNDMGKIGQGFSDTNL
ncbi:hypothetical protein DFH07DRAFT_777558 [Mycena maculata]|uniref:Uncharacterized protein n=1 Tax=Mycena maculata TaxID=230809 RepID=A0AAD7N1Z7_9AGAR|nr:hypothetical protein DFH07DRAFT_777558 [Mycena maculata]